MREDVSFLKRDDGVTQKIGLQSLVDLHVDTAKKYAIPAPKSFPQPVDQGPFPRCGLAAVLVALKARATLPPEKIPSLNRLFYIAKQLDITDAGSVFHIQFLQGLLSYFCVRSDIQIPKGEDYHDSLQDRLDSGRLVIVSADIDSMGSFPGVSAGLKTHWVVVFGYYHDANGDPYYLITQYGRYYVWSGVDLLKSNLQLCDKPNPHRMALTVFIDEGSDRFVRFQYGDAKKVVCVDRDAIHKKYRVLLKDGTWHTGTLLFSARKSDESLRNFACSMLSV